MGIQHFTLVHIAISIVGITSGFGMLAGLIAGSLLRSWTHVFLLSTIATSVTGFLFPFRGITPGIVVGAISLIALAVACYALYFRNLNGKWRMAFVVSGVLSLYLNVFVLVVQTFQKNPALAEIAPVPSAPASAVTQGVVLVIFIWLGILAVRRFRNGSPTSSAA